MFSWGYSKKYFEERGEWKESEIELHRTSCTGITCASMEKGQITEL